MISMSPFRNFLTNVQTRVTVLMLPRTFMMNKSISGNTSVKVSGKSFVIAFIFGWTVGFFR